MSQTKAQLLDNIKDNVQLDARNSLRFADTDSSHYVAFKAPATVSSNVTWTLPAADGSANYVLATDGSGTLSWIADPAGQWTTSGSNIYFTGGNVGIGDSSPSNPLSVTGASAFNGDLTLTGSSYNVVWDKSDNALEFADNAKAVFGAGSDLEVYHSGSHSYIKDTGTGDLFICSDDLHIGNAANSEDMAVFKENGAVELYYDNSKRIETTSYGLLSSNQVRINSSNATTVGFSCGDAGTGFYNSGSNAIGYSANGTQKWNINSAGDLSLVDGVELKLGTGDDLVIKHDSANTYFTNITGDLVLNSDSIRLRKQDGLEDYLKCIANGAVELYHNGTKKFETLTNGAKVSGNLYVEDAGTHFKSNQLSFHPAGAVYIDHTIVDQDIIFRTSDSSALDTTALTIDSSDAGTAIFNHDVKVPDNGKFIAGASDDLQLYHDGTNCILDSNTGEFLIRNLSGSGAIYLDAKTGERGIKVIADGAVELYYDNSKTFETTSAGGTLTGALTVTNEINLFNGTANASRYIDAGLGDDNSLVLRGCSGGDANHETLAQFTRNGAVELYYNNFKSFQTNSAGINLYGPQNGDCVIDMVSDEGDDNADLWRQRAGQGGVFYLQNYAPGSWDTFYSAAANGGIGLYYDNDKKMETYSGGVLIGRTSAGNTGFGHTLRGGDSCIFSRNSDTGETLQISRNTNDSVIVQFRAGDSGNATQIGHIDKSGSGVTYNSDSDYRKKENDVVISDGITKLKQLRPIRFNYKENPDKTFDGFFAHEVHPVVPEIVTGTKDAVVTQDDIDNGDYEQSEKDDPKYQSMDYGRLTPLLTAALQEAITKIETLETKVAALESA